MKFVVKMKRRDTMRLMLCVQEQSNFYSVRWITLKLCSIKINQTIYMPFPKNNTYLFYSNSKMNFNRKIIVIISFLPFSEIPKEPPIITGGLHSYQLGDRLELNCTSSRTFPATSLQWALNGQKVIFQI